MKENDGYHGRYTEGDIVMMLEFLVDNVLRLFGFCFAGKVFKHIVGLPRRRNCTTLLADIFQSSLEKKRNFPCKND